MSESGAGLKVLKWLVSSGLANDNSFLKDEKFAEILMEFVVAEELQELSWRWIKRAFENSPQYLTLSGREKLEARKDLVRPLMLLIKAEVSSSNNLDSAYLCISRAAGYLKGMTSSQMMVVLGPPGSYLSYITGMKHLDYQAPSESAFDSFLSLVPVISKDTGYHFAHLNLYHPSHPSADGALSYLQKLDTSSPPNHLPRTIITGASTLRNIIELGLTTAKFLIEKDRFDDADWVMTFLQSRFPEELGVQGKLTIAQAKAEAASLQLLEGLSFA